MSAMKTHAAFENNFASILYKHYPEKINNFTREWSDHVSVINVSVFKWQRNLVANLNK